MARKKYSATDLAAAQVAADVAGQSLEGARDAFASAENKAKQSRTAANKLATELGRLRHRADKTIPQEREHVHRRNPRLWKVAESVNKLRDKIARWEELHDGSNDPIERYEARCGISELERQIEWEQIHGIRAFSTLDHLDRLSNIADETIVVLERELADERGVAEAVQLALAKKRRRVEKATKNHESALTEADKIRQQLVGHFAA